MAFWNNPSEIYPLTQYSWTLELSTDINTLAGFATDELQVVLKSCTKPSFEIGVSEHKLLTQTEKFPTTLKWNPIEVKLVATKDTERKIELVINRLGYNTPYTETDSDTEYKHQSIKKLDERAQYVTIKQFSADAEELQKWQLYNAFISSVNYGNLSYETDGFVETSLTIQYDYAILGGSIIEPQPPARPA